MMMMMTWWRRLIKIMTICWSRRWSGDHKVPSGEYLKMNYGNELSPLSLAVGCCCLWHIWLTIPCLQDLLYLHDLSKHSKRAKCFFVSFRTIKRWNSSPFSEFTTVELEGLCDKMCNSLKLTVTPTSSSNWTGVMRCENSFKSFKLSFFFPRINTSITIRA